MVPKAIRPQSAEDAREILDHGGSVQSVMHMLEGGDDLPHYTAVMIALEKGEPPMVALVRAMEATGQNWPTLDDMLTEEYPMETLDDMDIYGFFPYRIFSMRDEYQRRHWWLVCEVSAHGPA